MKAAERMELMLVVCLKRGDPVPLFDVNRGTFDPTRDFNWSNSEVSSTDKCSLIVNYKHQAVNCM